ncbi:hypothetical protein PR048_017501 [Dryococelus australis]|uniref:CCHC-type domain-containing protein n=1 Tax=Dryococelus australis TaxID=614101 RepID=A0ABQ9H9P5_9NEOP|nr:hypothetical protein PR048_017501 [Dryococelus australis]
MAKPNDANINALSFILLIVSDDYLDDIAECTKVTEAWLALKEIRLRYGLLHQIMFVQELINVRKTADMSIQEYMSKIQDLNCKVRKSGIVFTDQVLALIFLMGLPMEKSLERDKETLNTKLVQARLLIEDKRMNRDVEEEEMKQRICICCACGEKGHIAKNCAQHRDENKGRGERLADEDEAREINKSEVSEKEYRVLCVKQTILKSSEWLLDSAASHHMTPYPELIENMTDETSVVGMADGGPLQIRG